MAVMVGTLLEQVREQIDQVKWNRWVYYAEQVDCLVEQTECLVEQTEYLVKQIRVPVQLALLSVR